MSDLAEIAAAAGITIIDDNGADEKGDADEKDIVKGDEIYANKAPVTDADLEQINALDAAFADRYTMADPDYARAFTDSELLKQTPCVLGYSACRPRRDYNRDRRGGNRGRAVMPSLWNRDRGDNRDFGNWNRGERSQYQPHSSGDHFHRGYESQHNRSEGNGRHSWGNSNDQGRTYGQQQYRDHHGNYQNRAHENYQGRQGQHSRDGGDRWNKNGNQRSKNSTSGSYRERSPQK
ncbi:hypothetical protein BsWGS_10152 [Bradybaena similaris]